MMQPILASRHFLAGLLAMGTGAFLFYVRPFPEESFFLHLISLRSPNAFLSFQWLYNVCLFSTPYFLYLGVFGALCRHAEIPEARHSRTLAAVPRSEETR
jgi:hypothetical protein